MNLSKHETANGWLSYMHEKGISVPITLCQDIETSMKKDKITFEEAFNALNKKKRIVFTDKEVVYTPPNNY